MAKTKPKPRRTTKAQPVKFKSPKPKITKTKIKGQDPRPYLAGAAPGLWASNHLEEANQCKGWQFVAVRTLARMCSQAELSIHRVDQSGIAKEQVEKLERRISRVKEREKDPILKSHFAARLEQKRDKWLRKATLDSVPQGRAEVPPTHPLWKLMQRCNPEWSGPTFIYSLVQQIGLTGMGLVWCVRNGMGVPLELYVIPTGLAVPRMPTEQFPKGSYWVAPMATWGYQPQDTWSLGAMGTMLMTGVEIDARDVKKICYPHPLYLTDALSPLSAGALWVDLGNEMDRAAWYSFQNSERPGMIFKQDPMINPPEPDKIQFREDLRSESAGTPNTGKHLLMPPGIDAAPRAMTPEEIEFVGSRPQIRDMNLALQGVTPQSCAIAEAQSFAGFQASLKQTTELTVQPLLNMVAGELTEFLGSSFDGRYEIRYTAPSVDDPQVLDNRLRTDSQAGNVLLVREYRALRGLPPLGDERDEEFAGVKITARVDDKDPSLPGVQQGAQDASGKENQDQRRREPDDKGEDQRQPFRDAPNGRPDRNGKSYTNGHASRFTWDGLLLKSTPEIETQPLTKEVARPDSPLTLNLNIQGAAPQTINFAPQAQPFTFQVQMPSSEPIFNVPEQPPPVVNVLPAAVNPTPLAVEVAAPVVNVEPTVIQNSFSPTTNVAAPNVTNNFAPTTTIEKPDPAQVFVKLERPAPTTKVVEVQRDRFDNMLGATIREVEDQPELAPKENSAPSPASASQ